MKFLELFKPQVNRSDRKAVFISSPSAPLDFSQVDMKAIKDVLDSYKVIQKTNGNVDFSGKLNYNCVEVSKEIYDYIFNSLSIDYGFIKTHSRMYLDNSGGMDIICVSYEEFFSFVKSWSESIKDLQSELFAEVGKLDEAIVYATSLSKLRDQFSYLEPKNPE